MWRRIKLSIICLSLFVPVGANGQEVKQLGKQQELEVSLYAYFCPKNAHSETEGCKWVLITSNTLDPAFNGVACVIFGQMAVKDFQEKNPTYLSQRLAKWRCAKDPPAMST